MFDAVPRFGQKLPEVTSQELIAQLVPTREFQQASFDNYRPDPNFLSQSVALEQCKLFAASRKRGKSSGLYLDGGFGVGKTHLLVSIYKSFPGTKVIGSFLSFTSLIGALGFAEAVKLLRKFSLICIDEFELDDPGNTMIMSRLMSELSTNSVFAVTSNTPPNALGEGRFAADSFKREIVGIGDRFDVLRIDGEDFRHRGFATEHRVFSEVELQTWLTEDSGGRVSDFDELLRVLSSLHPSRYEKLLEGSSRIGLLNAHVIQDEFDALRFVSFVDRAYEQQVLLRATQTALPDTFTETMLRGGYAKKYSRAISRLGSLVE
ncbi:MAG: hypothetical protein RLZZ400_312 [Actinomycetota bacterium]|jgi:cell division protein ZapE